MSPRIRTASLENPDAAHEESDINVRAIIWFVRRCSRSSCISHVRCGACSACSNTIEAKNDPAVSPLCSPPAGRCRNRGLQTTPWADLKTFRPSEDRYLHSYGWVDKSAGVARIPIDKAKAMLLQKGLPVSTDAGRPDRRHARRRERRSRPAGGTFPPAAPARAGAGRKQPRLRGHRPPSHRRDLGADCEQPSRRWPGSLP